MTDYQERLREWDRMCGEDLLAKPTMPIEAQRLLRCRLLLEETLEYIKASGCAVHTFSTGRMEVASRPDVFPPNLAAMAHENADVLYIAFGNANRMGVDAGAVFEEVHAANMRKGHGGVLLRRPDGKILKPNGWRPADVGSVLERQR